MSADTLNTLVSGAIWRAEQLGELGLEVERAWLEVSRLEEELAKIIPAIEGEGRIARRGAVRAALKAGDFMRATDLFEQYVAEVDAPKALCAELRKLLRADAEELSEQYPCAAKHHKLNKVQRLASRLQLGGPFGLAA